MTYLTDAQVEVLLRPIRAGRVGKTRMGNRQVSHVEAYELRAHLNRIFGFGLWSQDVLAMEQVFETITDEDKVYVGYRAQVRLSIYALAETGIFGEDEAGPMKGLDPHQPPQLLATYTEWAMGGASNFAVTSRLDAHDFAAKTAESQALKRCCANLGDQFGLSLYKQGSLDALVGKTLVGGPVTDGDGQVDGTPPALDSHVETTPPEADDGASAEQPEGRVTTTVYTNPYGNDDPWAGDPNDTRQVTADVIRDEALAVSGSKDARMRALAALKIKASRERLVSQVVGDETSQPITLGALLDRIVKEATRR